MSSRKPIRHQDLSDNLYEAVIPKDEEGDQIVSEPSAIKIPPEAEIVNSEGLDGLDKPDPLDVRGVDGDKEWDGLQPDGNGNGKDAPQEPPPTLPARKPSGDDTTGQDASWSDYDLISPPSEMEAEAIADPMIEAIPPLPEDTETPVTTKHKVKAPSKLDILKAKAGETVGEMKRKIADTVQPRAIIKKAKGKTSGTDQVVPSTTTEKGEDIKENPVDEPHEMLDVSQKSEEAASDSLEASVGASKSSKSDSKNEMKEKAKKEEKMKKEQEKAEKERAKAEEKSRKLNEKIQKEKSKEEAKVLAAKQKEEEKKAKEEEKKAKEEEKMAKQKVKEEARISKEKAKEDARQAKEKAKEEARLAKEQQKLEKEKEKGDNLSKKEEDSTKDEAMDVEEPENDGLLTVDAGLEVVEEENSESVEEALRSESQKAAKATVPKTTSEAIEAHVGEGNKEKSRDSKEGSSNKGGSKLFKIGNTDLTAFKPFSKLKDIEIKRKVIRRSKSPRGRSNSPHNPGDQDSDFATDKNPKLVPTTPLKEKLENQLASLNKLKDIKLPERPVIRKRSTTPSRTRIEGEENEERASVSDTKSQDHEEGVEVEHRSRSKKRVYPGKEALEKFENAMPSLPNIKNIEIKRKVIRRSASPGRSPSRLTLDDAREDRGSTDGASSNQGEKPEKILKPSPFKQKMDSINSPLDFLPDVGKIVDMAAIKPRVIKRSRSPGRRNSELSSVNSQTSLGYDTVDSDDQKRSSRTRLVKVSRGKEKLEELQTRLGSLTHFKDIDIRPRTIQRSRSPSSRFNSRRRNSSICSEPDLSTGRVIKKKVVKEVRASSGVKESLEKLENKLSLSKLKDIDFKPKAIKRSHSSASSSGGYHKRVPKKDSISSENADRPSHGTEEALNRSHSNLVLAPSPAKEKLAKLEDQISIPSLASKFKEYQPKPKVIKRSKSPCREPHSPMGSTFSVGSEKGQEKRSSNLVLAPNPAKEKLEQLEKLIPTMTKFADDLIPKAPIRAKSPPMKPVPPKRGAKKQEANIEDSTYEPVQGGDEEEEAKDQEVPKKPTRVLAPAPSKEAIEKIQTQIKRIPSFSKIKDDLKVERKVIKKPKPIPPIPKQPERTDLESKSPEHEAKREEETALVPPVEDYGSNLPSDQNAATSPPIPEPPQSTNKESKDKGDKLSKLNKLGQKSKAIASTTTKSLGKTVSTIGKDISKFGNKMKQYQASMSEKAKKTTKPKDDNVNKEEQTMQASPPHPNYDFEFIDEPEPEATEVRNVTRGYVPLEEEEDGKDHVEELPNFDKTADIISRNELIGRAERDWESPIELERSRDPSQGRADFSDLDGSEASQESLPGSSMASSFANMSHQGRQGVLEEIDSDEFFLRERGISEGEDAEEVNRVVAEELRQTFRPNISNALAGFDAALKPDLIPRKPPRKTDRDDRLPNYDTYPPERPKRKKLGGGAVASYLADYEDTLEQYEEDEDSENFESFRDDNENEEDLNDPLRRVKEELSKIDRAMEHEEDELSVSPIKNDPELELMDRMEYEMIENEEPGRSNDAGPSTAIYYNTAPSNAWMKELEQDILTHHDLASMPPIPPSRETRRSQKSKEETESSQEQKQLVEPEEEIEGHVIQASLQIGHMQNLLDEAGYSLIQKYNEPSTVPRRKKKSKPSRKVVKDVKDNGSLAFFSLPRFTPRTLHIVPPTRPHRAYSALGPSRPPRKSKSNQELKSPTPYRDPSPHHGPEQGFDSRVPQPSNIVRLIQDRPLPPPPIPSRRLEEDSPPPPNLTMNDLDIEMSFPAENLPNYANVQSMSDPEAVEVVEPPCVARNIPLLGRPFGDERQFIDESDLFHEPELEPDSTTKPSRYEYDATNLISSFESQDCRIDSSNNQIPNEEGNKIEEAPCKKEENDNQPTPPARRVVESRSQPVQTVEQGAQPMQFPSRVQLEELEVNFLRVNGLNAQSINVDRLQSPHLEINSMTATGPMNIPSLRTQTLNATEVTTERLVGENAEFPSMPPPSFYQLAATPPPGTVSDTKPEKKDDLLKSHVTSQESDFRDDEPEERAISASMQLLLSESESDMIIKPISTSTTSVPYDSQRERSRNASPRPHQSPTSLLDSDDVFTLSLRLGRAVGRALFHTIQAISDYVELAVSEDPEKVSAQRANLKILMCIFMVFVAGIILIGRSDGSSQKWEYYLPPHDL